MQLDLSHQLPCATALPDAASALSVRPCNAAGSRLVYSVLHGCLLTNLSPKLLPGTSRNRLAPERILSSVQIEGTLSHKSRSATIFGNSASRIQFLSHRIQWPRFSAIQTTRCRASSKSFKRSHDLLWKPSLAPARRCSLCHFN